MDPMGLSNGPHLSEVSETEGVVRHGAVPGPASTSGGFLNRMGGGDPENLRGFLWFH